MQTARFPACNKPKPSANCGVDAHEPRRIRLPGTDERQESPFVQPYAFCACLLAVAMCVWCARGIRRGRNRLLVSCRGKKKRQERIENAADVCAKKLPPNIVPVRCVLYTRMCRRKDSRSRMNHRRPLGAKCRCRRKIAIVVESAAEWTSHAVGVGTKSRGNPNPSLQ